MLERGIYLAPSAFEAGFMSSAHTDDDIAMTLTAARQAMQQAMSSVIGSVGDGISAAPAVIFFRHAGPGAPGNMVELPADRWARDVHLQPRSRPIQQAKLLTTRPCSASMPRARWAPARTVPAAARPKSGRANAQTPYARRAGDD